MIAFDKECAYQAMTLKRTIGPLENKRNNALQVMALLSGVRATQTLSKIQLAAIHKSEADARGILRRIPQIMIDKLNLQLEVLGAVSERIDVKINEYTQLMDQFQ